MPREADPRPALPLSTVAALLKDEPEISRALVLSTIHLPDRCVGPVAELAGLGVEAIVDPTPYGWRLYVGCDEPDPCQYGRLGQAAMVARHLGCRWLEFDRDGEEVATLPRWDESGDLLPWLGHPQAKAVRP